MADSEQMMCEALRLIDLRRHVEALKLLEQLRANTCDVHSQCVYLLNERRCLSAMRDHHRARHRLLLVEQIDVAGEFRLETELGRISDLHAQEHYENANQHAKAVMERYATFLAQPENADLAWELKFSLARGLICLQKFEEGLKALPDPLQAAQPEATRRCLYFRALACRHLKREGEAIDTYKQIVASCIPDQWVADAHYDLGMIYGSRRSFAWAKQHLQAADTMKDLLSVPLSYLYGALAITCRSLQELDEARKYARLAKSSDS